MVKEQALAPKEFCPEQELRVSCSCVRIYMHSRVYVYICACSSILSLFDGLVGVDPSLGLAGLNKGTRIRGFAVRTFCSPREHG